MPPVNTSVDITVHLPFTILKIAEKNIPLEEQRDHAIRHIQKGTKDLKGNKDLVVRLATIIDQITCPCNDKDKTWRTSFIIVPALKLQKKETKWIRIEGEKDKRVLGESVKEQLDRAALRPPPSTRHAVHATRCHVFVRFEHRQHAHKERPDPLPAFEMTTVDDPKNDTSRHRGVERAMTGAGITGRSRR